ncbi:MAG: hypothetical protein M1378_10700, partial [Bacteroidetes bacterium]|nr:hypothetical protein [Bacteroidota bacterium]
MKSAVTGMVVILTAGTMFGQVHIKENVIISPADTKGVQAGTINNNVLHFNLSLQSRTDSAIVVVDGPAGFHQVYSALGSVSGDILSPAAGGYSFTPCTITMYHSFDPGNCFSVAYNGTDIGGEHCGSGMSGSYGSWVVMKDLVKRFSTPYFSNFHFTLSGINPFYQPDYLGHGEEGGIEVEGDYDSTTTAWSPHTDSLTLTITSGSQYASFHRLDYKTWVDQKLGSSITIRGDSIYAHTRYTNGIYYIVADGEQPDSNAGLITVRAESNGLAETKSLEILPPPIVTVTPNELSPGDTAAITVKHRDLDGKLVDYPPSQLFEVGVLDSGASGYVWSSDGDIGDRIRRAKAPFSFGADEIDSDS